MCHVSLFEPDAYARWAGCRLPSEAEWETCASDQPVAGAFQDPGRLHPGTRSGTQLFGTVWQWTASSYGAYPGFRPDPGAVGEYNGKFMVNQHVLRGGSCATPAGHVRPTYRNFFPASARWAFSGSGWHRCVRTSPPAANRTAVVVENLLDPVGHRAALLGDLRHGLTSSQKRVSPVWFYDDAGSELFDRITRLPEYYITRCEREILSACAPTIAARTTATTLVELGSGTSEKTTILLDALDGAGHLRRFVPFDVSGQTLRSAAAVLHRSYPRLSIHGIVGDFHHHLSAIPPTG